MGRDTWQAIDANAIIDESGTPWLAFGSFWDGIKLVKLKDDMSAMAWPQEWLSLARRPSTQQPYEYELTDSQIEAAFLYEHKALVDCIISFRKSSPTCCH